VPEPVAVSVIVAVRDVVTHIGAALASIAAQTRPVDEIVVVDGRSTDGTLDVVAEFPDARVVTQPDDGLAQARNLGLRATSGSVVAFLDGDDRWEPEKTARQLVALDADPALGLVAGQMERVRTGADGETITEIVPALTPGGVLVRRSVFAAVGGFDERYRIGTDTDWFMRVRDAGLGPSVLPDVILHKGVRPERLSRDVSRYRAELLQAARDAARRRDPR
jgi:glycosyltransferase involved in cell wall biosynthesis